MADKKGKSGKREERTISVIGAIPDPEEAVEEGDTLGESLGGFIQSVFEGVASAFSVGGKTTDGLVETIQNDEKAGNIDQISYVLVDPERLAALLEEGTVNVFHLQHSVGEDPFICVIPDVQFGSYSYPVKVAHALVCAELTDGYLSATMTADNKVV